MPTKSAERILVRAPNWLGDVVMATPGLRALREARLDARIVVQLPGALMPLLEGLELCDELWPIEPRSAGLSVLHEESRRVAEARFQLGVLIPESISSALRMRFGRVERIVGFARDPIRRRLLHDVVVAPPEWGRRRMVSRERFVMTLMSGLGVPSRALRLELAVTQADEAKLETVLRKQGVDRARLEADRPIVFAPGAGFGDAKRWPADRFAALADRAAARGRRVCLLGAPGESAILDQITNCMSTSPVVFDGSLDLAGVKALIRIASEVVTNDAGARHMAAAFGVPSVVFLGPTAREKTPDNLEAVEVLEKDFACRPCYRRTCPIDHRCLRSISVDEADAAVSRALARAGQPERVVEQTGAIG